MALASSQGGARGSEFLWHENRINHFVVCCNIAVCATFCDLVAVALAKSQGGAVALASSQGGSELPTPPASLGPPGEMYYDDETRSYWLHNLETDESLLDWPPPPPPLAPWDCLD